MKKPFMAVAQSGFTLLEVLIALALLAILMIGLIKITADNSKNLWYLENKTVAATIAANHAVMLRLAKEKPEVDEGWENLAGRRWFWQISREGIQDLHKNIWTYHIEVFLEGDKSPYAGLISYIPAEG